MADVENERCRVIPGAVTNGELDEMVVELVSDMGQLGFRFIALPIGGWKRANWNGNGELPTITVPDMQADADFWGRFICGQISPWIDLDSADEELARISKTALMQELDYCKYLNLKAVTIPIRHCKSPRLAACMKTFLWTKCPPFRCWFIIPTDLKQLNPTSDCADLWLVWADFRCALSNHHFAMICLKLTPDLSDDFLTSRQHQRWMSEPISAIWIDQQLLTTHPSFARLCLPPAHVKLLESLTLILPQPQLLISAADEKNHGDELLKCMDSVVHLFKSGKEKSEPQEEIGSGYEDYLQIPLQPLDDDLDSHVYEIFEKDPIKYDQYEGAIEKAAMKLASERKQTTLTLMVLGAGRGPLISAALAVESRICRSPNFSDFRFNLIAVEKNANAIVSLQYKNRSCWKSRVRIVSQDMRRLRVVDDDYGSPDLIVSELLGSFGDNELSPECLDGIQPLLASHTISIPMEYKSYLAPIQSFKLRNYIWEFTPSRWAMQSHGRFERQFDANSCNQVFTQPLLEREMEWAKTDQPYVVKLHNYYMAAEPQPLFSFQHPNTSGKSNEREAKITFNLDQNCEIMGFAGYFDAKLFDDLHLSIVPSSKTETLISWFPAIFPLRRCLRVSAGSRLCVHLKRLIDEGGVWYEWMVEYNENGTIQSTEWQNVNAHAYYMRL